MSKSSEIAKKIHAYLQRWERDRSGVNKPGKYRVKYYYSNATARGGRVFVTYISYQGSSSLTIAEAEKYLAWIEAGNVGAHWESSQ